MLLSNQIKHYALNELKVDLIGITSAEPDLAGKQLLQTYVKENRQGEMHYLENAELRTNPENILPGAKSVIVIAINYYREKPETPPGHGNIARYAYGRDYHKVLRSILKKLDTYITTLDPTAKNRPCIDSAPLLEKSYAQKAGLGFLGKNTLLITKELGSFVLLGELLTTLELPADEPTEGTCGTCTRCIDACPTQAIIAPGQLDSRRCISYLTIEKRGEIPQEFHAPMKKLIFGCDICQEVCPYNKTFARPLTLEAFKEVKIAGDSLPIEEILAIQTDEEYLKKFAGSPLMRAKRTGLQRNARIAQANNK